MRSFLDEIRKFRQFLQEIGAGQSYLALPAPRMLAHPPSDEEPGAQELFSRVIVEPEIVIVSRDLFASGHFPLAIQEAFKAVEKYLQIKTESTASGTTLMEQIFSATKPQLVWSDRQNQSQKDEQMGYMKIYAGAVQGIRNPCTHEFNWVDDPDTALELMLLSQHLLRKSKSARRATS